MRDMTLKFNSKEKAAYKVLVDAGTDGKVSLGDIAGKAYPKKGTKSKTKGNSWTRNSLRKLVRLGFAIKAGRGTYQWTGKEYEEAEILAAEAEKAKDAPPKRKRPRRPRAKSETVLAAAVEAEASTEIEGNGRDVEDEDAVSADADADADEAAGDEESEDEEDEEDEDEKDEAGEA